MPIIPLGMNFGAELTFPMSPSLTNGILLMGGQIVGALVGLASSALAPKGSWKALALYEACCLVALFFSFFIKEDLKRANFNTKERETLRISQRLDELKHFGALS